MNIIEKERKKVALFIDCENVSYKLIDDIMERLAEVGEVCVKKAYGDWRSAGIKRWEESLIKYSIEPIHIITGNRNGEGGKSGKNSSDIKITIDVINTLYSGVMECIALATSDSDFAPLAQEIRTKGIPAIGFGEKKAREDFRKAFTSFEELGIAQPMDPQLSKDRILIKLLKDAVESTAGDDGKSLVSRVGLWIKNNYFKTASSYGRDGWGDVLKALPEYFDITYSGVNNSVMSVQYRKRF
ncbi:hypothetical protein BKH41_08215 [Helicobacter sp. 12S02232-10]|uniref:NYN domain-containing protein n=1 Tax=Helicobacter sp. 12S02232-10 TaxID=1476197 RepID=UPI000BA7BC01|nr:NYN domain-containing protein [Helicobacter sp. 12S02232-10]PAF47002.1 hypothetical protein BKH41_08215 [Helicobacter sp. 12S02232-10]